MCLANWLILGDLSLCLTEMCCNRAAELLGQKVELSVCDYNHTSSIVYIDSAIYNRNYHCKPPIYHFVPFSALWYISAIRTVLINLLYKLCCNLLFSLLNYPTPPPTSPMTLYSVPTSCLSVLTQAVFELEIC